MQRQHLTDAMIIDRSSRIAVRYAPPSMSREDLAQEGWLALLAAQRAGRVPADPAHREAYLSRRTLGGMMDAIGATWRADRVAIGMDELPDMADPASDPARLVALREAITVVARRCTPQAQRYLALLADQPGMSAAEAAAQLGTHISRVEQLRAGLRRLMAPLW